MPGKRRVLDGAVAWMAQLVGGGSLVLFAIGPRGFVELGLSDGGVLAWDAALSLAFFLQHSVMVRRPVKARLGRHVPDHLLGALFAVGSGAVLALAMLLWQRTAARIASGDGLLRLTGLAGLAVAVAGVWWGVASLRRFDPFGVRPIQLRRLGRTARPQELVIRGPYRWVRHPLYLFMLVLIWSSVDLTLDRLLFDVLWTAWIVVGTVLEERDLVAEMGQAYVAYQHRVPMLLPWRRPAGAGGDPVTG